MLGGGQLGRMFAIEALRMGYRVLVLEPDPLSPAGQVADRHFIGAYDDEQVLNDFAEKCDVITTEFENIPATTLDFLTRFCPVRPSATTVQAAQDRILEKEFFRSCGLLPVPFLAVRSVTDLNATEGVLTFPAILKTARLGYDGKGQVRVNTVEDAIQAFERLGQVECVLEQQVELASEISVVLGRNQAGDMYCFPVVENRHRHGILHQSIAPARIETALADSAQAAARRIADKLEFVGVLAVEFFVTAKGELLVNEMAPRTHNSGHYTLDACVTSQFEQQVRMVCDLPFGEVRQHTPVVMVNLLGELWGSEQPDWSVLMASPNTKLHLYGKKTARRGRKMGHFCVMNPDLDAAFAEAERLFADLEAAMGQQKS